MRIINVDSLEGNEIVASPILTKDLKVLIGKGTKLKKEYIKKLIDHNISEIYIEEDSNALFSLGGIISKQEVQETCLLKVQNILEKHTFHNSKNLEELVGVAEDIINNILSNEKVLEKVYEFRERDANLYEHSLSVCALAVLTCVKMKIPKNTINDIGIAAILHDLGLRYTTVPFTNVDINELSQKDQEEYRKHTVFGYTAIIHEDWLSDQAKKMILFHHEKLGGKGYPLKSNELTTECQIVSVCELFDESICGVGCKRMRVYEAIELLKSTKGIEYDAEIVDTLLQFTAIYPTGTKVRLSDGSIGIVARQNEHFPERPVVTITIDKNGTKVTDQIQCDMVLVHNIVITEMVE